MYEFAFCNSVKEALPKQRVNYNAQTYLQTPLRGFRQCLPFSWTTLRDKHCQHPIAVMGVVDTFGHICLNPYGPKAIFQQKYFFAEDHVVACI